MLSHRRLSCLRQARPLALTHLTSWDILKLLILFISFLYLTFYYEHKECIDTTVYHPLKSGDAFLFGGGENVVGIAKQPLL